jgi:hypothetical protein
MKDIEGVHYIKGGDPIIGKLTDAIIGRFKKVRKRVSSSVEQAQWVDFSMRNIAEYFAQDEKDRFLGKWMKDEGSKKKHVYGKSSSRRRRRRSTMPGSSFRPA